MKTTERNTVTRSQAINIRVSPGQRDIIDQAAQAVGKSRSEFMLDTAYREAIDVLLDQRFFLLDADAYDRFVELLDAPPSPSPALRRLLETPAPWDE
jgi:uncharacterized protein (DUF1778 family)